MKLSKLKALLLLVILSACQSEQIQRTTIADIDRVATTSTQSNDNKLITRNISEIKSAYQLYLESSHQKDNTRRQALIRLAELEFDVVNMLSTNSTSIEQTNDQQLESQLRKTISLYQEAIRDYPDSKANDKILYQLAKAYDQLGESENVQQTLSELVEKYPHSELYAESQFRIAELFFSHGDYISAEDAYTEVIVSPKNQIYSEKALYKRGWAKFKQGLFNESINDISMAIEAHRFDEISNLEQSEKETLTEYLRALALSFINLDTTAALKEYFIDESVKRYEYETYLAVSDMYLSQERFSDSALVLNEYIANHQESGRIADAKLLRVDVWKKSKFNDQMFKEIESFYQDFELSKDKWKLAYQTESQFENLRQKLRQHLITVSSHYHNQFLLNNNQADQKSAYLWYQRYLKHFESSARTDKIYLNLAELQKKSKQAEEALKYYELAAFQDDLLLDKEAAYQAIQLCNQLITDQNSRQILAAKLVQYALTYIKIYNQEPQAADIISVASSQGYQAGYYEQVIELSSYLPLTSSDEIIKQVKIYTAQSFYQLKQFESAEYAYKLLLDNKNLSRAEQKSFVERLALSIYYQAEDKKSLGLIDESTYHYLRVKEVAPHSEIAATALFDGIANLVKTEKWDQVIYFSNLFQSEYPNNKHAKELVRTLSVAYLKTNDQENAAKQFSEISKFEQDRDIKKTALWQAAELYQANNNFTQAVTAFTEYANSYPQPIGQNFEAMHKLVELYHQNNNSKLRNVWLNRILKLDKSLQLEQRTTRTATISSSAALTLAIDFQQQFESIRLTLPLKNTLARKKKSMQAAVNMFAQAASYNLTETSTRSIHSIASIYASFSRALLESERPNHLDEVELEQYNLLLEDQAFPFEDKAIEFYERNLNRISEGVFDDWVTQSLAQLKLLFPVKYAKKAKIDSAVLELD